MAFSVSPLRNFRRFELLLSRGAHNLANPTITTRAISRSSSGRVHLLHRPFLPRLSFPRSNHQRRFNSNYSSPAGVNPKSEPTSFSARMKQLSREYGYGALAVYFGLSALDFPFCFLAVRYLGKERIAIVEQTFINTVTNAFRSIAQGVGLKVGQEGDQQKVAVVQGNETGVSDLEQAVAVVQGNEAGVSGLEQVDREARNEGASLWTELVLAYAIHKSFIFIRVPLTVAVTPKLVKVLRGWGWNIGRKRRG